VPSTRCSGALLVASFPKRQNSAEKLLAFIMKWDRRDGRLVLEVVHPSVTNTGGHGSGLFEVATARFHSFQQIRLIVVSPNHLWSCVDTLGQDFRRPTLIAVVRDRTSPYSVGRTRRRTARFIAVFTSLAVVRIPVMWTNSVAAWLRDDIESRADRSFRHSTSPFLA